MEPQNLKQELLQMLSSWREEQEQRFTKFSNEQTATLSKLVSELSDLKLQNITIQQTNFEIEKNVKFISNQYDDMVKLIERLQKEKQDYRDSLTFLETKVQDLQLLSRPSTIEIRNVPAKEKETPTDLCTIISKVGAAANMAIPESQLRDTYRIPGKPGTTRPIIVEFSNVHTKNQLLTCVRNFNKDKSKENRLNTSIIGLPGDRAPIYVAEHLPASSRKLYYLAREFSKKYNYEFCWTSNGNVLLRKKTGLKSIVVKSEQTLRDLQSGEIQDLGIQQSSEQSPKELNQQPNLHLNK